MQDTVVRIQFINLYIFPAGRVSVMSGKEMREYAFASFMSQPQIRMKDLSYNTEGIVMITLVEQTSRIQFLLDTVVSSRLAYFKEVIV